MSRRQRRIAELEFAKPIKIPKSKRFESNPGYDFDTWWIMIQVCIEHQPEMFPNDESTIDWIGSLLDKYATERHIQWIEGTLNGSHSKSMTGYINARKLRFEDKDGKDKAYAHLQAARYEGCITDMFTQIQMFTETA